MSTPPDSDAQARLAHILDRLRQAGRRLTPQRLAVLEALLADPGHPSAEQLFKAVSRRFPTMSLATVYKTLAMLKEQGEVLELGFAGQESRYDGLIPRPHPHLVCLRCGALADPPSLDLTAFVQAAACQTGYRISSHRLDFYGLCPKCAAAEDDQAAPADK